MNGKEAMSFLHDSNSRHDVKMLKLWEKFGYEGIGVFWCVVEILREQPDFKYSIDDISLIGIELRISKDLIKDLIRFCLQPNISLFIEEDKHFFSESLLRRMDKFKESRLRMSQGGKLGMERRYSKGVSKVVISKLQGTNKVKEKKTNIIETKIKIISSLKKIWFEQIEFYKEKYPGIDYNLELEKMEDWIGRNFNEAKKRSNWNLFIQSWLGRIQPHFKSKQSRQFAVGANPNSIPEPTTEERIQHWQGKLDQAKAAAADMGLAPKVRDQFTISIPIYEREIASLHGEAKGECG